MFQISQITPVNIAAIIIANPNVKDEQLRRFPICCLDEGINQTKEILKRQAEFSRRGISSDYNEVITEALRKLKRVKVKVLFAEKLTKLFNPQEVIVRTHFPRFLDYIKTSCALHQYQRKTDSEGYLIAQPQDYDIGRIALMKTTDNILMIPLTKLRRDILEAFEKQDIHNKSVEELHSSFKSIQKLNISSEWLRKQLDFLVSKGFLDKSQEHREAKKPVSVYSFNKIQKLIIPEWKDIDKTPSFASIDKTNSFNKINSVNNKDIDMASINSSFNNSQNPKITQGNRLNELNELNPQQTHISPTDQKKPNIKVEKV